MATAEIADGEMLKYAERIKGKVVVLTGGANGIGRDTAILCAQYGSAMHVRCNVLEWDDQVALFEQAIAHFGAVDVVVPAAGISEHSTDFTGILNYRDGKPLPPDMLTLQINLIGAIRTVHLGLHYLRSTRSKPDDWKALVLIGSMASWEAIPLTSMYTTSKFAIRGLMRSLYPLVKRDNIRIACVDPVWADTQILSASARFFLRGSELLTVRRISQTIFCAATDPDESTNGCSWLLPDATGPVLRVERESLDQGTYKMINDPMQMRPLFEKSLWLIVAMIVLVGYRFWKM
ncbi:hypothetical protein FB45DRAFT_988220 [Roridomyces roridus]|uniref:NAD(P)-binding protein n=1 Tax=Roridomyces roridus TaxID=1738132 RepID=A0AAD7FVK3_9AGAR|nr:hypothetical protein FB45DRAFT_988220 [Roridomyces roridus]